MDKRKMKSRSFREFEVSEDVMGYIIGNQGSNINSARQIEGVLRIDVRGNRKICIYGGCDEAVDTAKNMLEFVKDEIIIPESVTKYIIGKKGETIKNIKIKSGVKYLRINKNKSDVRCSIIGRRVNVNNSKEMLKNLVTQYQKTEKQSGRKFETVNSSNRLSVKHSVPRYQRITNDINDTEEFLANDTPYFDGILDNNLKLFIFIYEILNEGYGSEILLILMNEVLKLRNEDERKFSEWMFELFISEDAPFKILLTSNEKEDVIQEMKDGEINWAFFPAIIRAQEIVNDQIKYLDILARNCIEEYCEKFSCASEDLFDLVILKTIHKYSAECELKKLLEIIINDLFNSKHIYHF